jgi:acylphosphatase
MICRRSFVSGRVQGVFYRATCCSKGVSLGLTGYARNLADGRVEVMACGEDAAVNEFVAWLWKDRRHHASPMLPPSTPTPRKVSGR